MEPAGTNLASYEIITGRRAASGSAEAAMVRMEPDGQVRVSLGDPPSGQGYETVLAQIVADELGLTPDAITVARGFDSATTPWLYLSGNYSNKFSVTDVGAVVGAAARVRAKLLRIAAHRLEAAVADLELGGGAVAVRGAPDRRLSFAELARTAYADVLGLPPGEEPGLEARHAHQNPLAQPIDGERRVRSQLVFSNAAHCCLVEVDPRTGMVKILDYVVVHDCGRELNPLIVEGMVHGATAHGIGAALLEEFRYDAQGQLLTSTFMDYLKPTAMDVPAHRRGPARAPLAGHPARGQGRGRGRRDPGPGRGRERGGGRARAPGRGGPLAADHAGAGLALARVSEPAPALPAPPVRWRLLTILTVSYGAGAFGMLGISPLSPSLVEGLGLTRFQVAFLVPSIYLSGLLFSVPGGRLADRLGVRPSFLGGLAVSAIGLLAAALAPGFLVFLFCLFVAGSGWSVVNPALGKAIMDVFPVSERGIAMGVKQMGLTLGGLVAALALPADRGHARLAVRDRGVLGDRGGAGRPRLAAARRVQGGSARRGGRRRLRRRGVELVVGPSARAGDLLRRPASCSAWSRARC